MKLAGYLAMSGMDGDGRRRMTRQGDEGMTAKHELMQWTRRKKFVSARRRHGWNGKRRRSSSSGWCGCNDAAESAATKKRCRRSAATLGLVRPLACIGTRSSISSHSPIPILPLCNTSQRHCPVSATVSDVVSTAHSRLRVSLKHSRTSHALAFVIPEIPNLNLPDVSVLDNGSFSEVPLVCTQCHMIRYHVLSLTLLSNSERLCPSERAIGLLHYLVVH